MREIYRVKFGVKVWAEDIMKKIIRDIYRVKFGVKVWAEDQV